jgi:hypothetical protein
MSAWYRDAIDCGKTSKTIAEFALTGPDPVRWGSAESSPLDAMTSSDVQASFMSEQPIALFNRSDVSTCPSYRNVSPLILL